MKHLLCICLLYLNNVALSQEPQYVHYTVTDGLPHMRINGLSADTLGNIWLATRGGISSFNGADFENYTDIACLPDYAFDVVVDDSSHVWIAGKEALYSFDGIACSTYPYPSWVEANFKFKLTVLADNSILGSTPFPMSPWIWKDGAFISYAEVNSIPETERILDIAIDTTRNVHYVATESAMLVVQDYNIIHTIPLNAQRALLTQGSSDHRIDDQQLIALYQDSLRYLSIDDKYNLVHNCTHTLEGDCILRSQGKQHSYYESRSNKLVVYNQKLQEDILIEDIKTKFNKVWDIVEVDESIYVLSDKGLIRWFPDQFFRYPESTLPYIWSIAQDPQGNIYAGSFGEGISLIEENSITQVPTHFISCTQADHDAKHRAGAQQIYYGSTTDNEGTLYFPTGAGISKLKDGVVEAFYTHCSPSMTVPHASLNTHYDHHTHTLLSCHCDGLYWLDMQGTAIRHISNEQLQSTICLQTVQTLHDTSYVGYSPYVARIVGDSVTLLSIQQDVAETYSCSMIDTDKVVWFGGRKGLYHVTEDSLIQFPFLSGQKVVAMTQHSPEKLFFSTTDAVIMFNHELYKRTGRIQYREYNASNGFSGIEPGYQGLFIDDQERLWITSASHLSYAHIPTLSYIETPAHIAVLSVNRKPVQFTQDVYHLEEHINDAEIKLSLIGAERPSTYNISYTICDEAYSLPTGTDILFLQNLQRGRHTVDVQVCDSAGSDIASHSFEIVVDIHVWEDPRWRFASLACIMFLGGLGLFLRMRLHNQRQKKRELEEKNRLAEQSKQRLSDLNLQLKNENTSLQYRIKNAQAAALPVDTDTVLKLGPKKDILVQLSEIVYAQSDRNRLTIHLQDDFQAVYMPLKELKEILPETLFAQVNRSTIINITKIAFKNVHDIKMVNNDSVTITKAYRDELERVLSQL